MKDVQEYVVSSSGQMSLPAPVRHRWKLDKGGAVDVIDLGFGVLTVPKGEGRRLLGDLLSREDHAAFVRSLDDDADLRDDVTRALLDDHLLRDLLADNLSRSLSTLLRRHEPATTNLYLHRLCKSVLSARGGTLTGTWAPEQRRELGRRLSSLPEEIEVVPMRTIAFRMAEIADAHRVSTLGAEAVAAAEHLGGALCVWQGDDGPGIRSATGAVGVSYRTLSR